MAEIVDGFGERFRKMVWKMHLSSGFARKLVEDVEGRRERVESAMRKMSMGMYGGR